MSEALVTYLQPLEAVPEGARDPFAGKIRVTPDGKISVLDVIKTALFTGDDGALTRNAAIHANTAFSRLAANYEEVYSGIVTWRFPGPGQRDTPVTDRRGLIKIVQLLPGKRAAAFRHSMAVLLERYLDADRSLADEIYARAESRDLTDDKRIKSSESTKSLMAAVRDSGMSPPNRKVFAVINDTENRTVTGMHTQEIRELHGMKRSDLTRDYFTEDLSAGIDLMNILNRKQIAKGVDPVKSITDIGDKLFGVFKDLNMHEDAKVARDRAFAKENRRKRRHVNTPRGGALVSRGL